MNLKEETIVSTLFLITAILSLIAFYKAYFCTNFNLFLAALTFSLFMLFQAILSYTKYKSDLFKNLFHLIKSASAFWFDILKWVLIMAAISFAANQLQDETLKLVLYISYIVVFLYIYAFILHSLTSLLDPVRKSPKICKLQRIIIEVSSYIVFGLIGWQLMKLFSWIPTLVQNLQAN